MLPRGGFGVVNSANALADAGLEPRRHYLVIMDELWLGAAGRAGHRRPHRHTDPPQPRQKA